MEMEMRCFVMMPFKPEFRDIRTDIREAASRAQVECIWNDEIFDVGRITEQIVVEIKKSWACIAEITGRNPNVVWELGFAAALGKPTIILAQSSDDLFFDLKDQWTIIYKVNERQGSLVQPLTLSLERLKQKMSSVPPEDLLGTRGHEKMTHVLGAKRLNDTPYGFFDLIKRAKSRIFLAAQNHYFFIETKERQERFRTSIRDFLLNNSSGRIDIMLCDDRKEYAIKTWQYVCTERYNRDLQRSIKFFREFYNWAQKYSDIRDRIIIKRVEFVPISITFLDPDEESGFLVIIPNFYEEKNIGRPCYIISRTRNDDIFQQYWAAYSHRFNDIVDINIF
jgi:hypothetical protein